MAAACEAFGELDKRVWAEHEAGLTRRLIDGLGRINGVHIARLWPDSADPSGIVTFTLAGFTPEVLAAALSAEYGIGVRDGRFCAHPLLARLRLPAGAVRASVGVHSSSDDVDRLVSAVAELATHGPRAEYVPDGAGNWVPADDQRRLPKRLGGGPLTVLPASPCAL